MCGLSVWGFIKSAMVQPAADCAITTSSFPAARTACYRLGAAQVSLAMHDVWSLLEPDRQQTSAPQSVLGRYRYGACAFGTALHVQKVQTDVRAGPAPHFEVATMYGGEKISS